MFGRLEVGRHVARFSPRGISCLVPEARTCPRTPNRAAKVLTDHQIIRRPDCGVLALGQRSFSQHNERSPRTRRSIVDLVCRRSVPDLEVARRSARLHSLREKIQWPCRGNHAHWRWQLRTSLSDRRMQFRAAPVGLSWHSTDLRHH